MFAACAWNCLVDSLSWSATLVAIDLPNERAPLAHNCTVTMARAGQRLRHTRQSCTGNDRFLGTPRRQGTHSCVKKKQHRIALCRTQHDMFVGLTKMGQVVVIYMRGIRGGFAGDSLGILGGFADHLGGFA